MRLRFLMIILLFVAILMPVIAAPPGGISPEGYTISDSVDFESMLIVSGENDILQNDNIMVIPESIIVPVSMARKHILNSFTTNMVKTILAAVENNLFKKTTIGVLGNNFIRADN